MLLHRTSNKSLVFTMFVKVSASVGNRAARERAEKKVLMTASCKIVE